MQQVHDAGSDIEDARVRAVNGPQVLDVRHADALHGYLAVQRLHAPALWLGIVSGEPVWQL